MATDTLGLMKLLQTGSSPLGMQASLLKSPNEEQNLGEGLLGLADRMNGGSNAGGAVKGFLEGYGAVQNIKGGKKRAKQTEALMAELQRAQELNAWADGVQRELAEVKLAQEQKMMMAESFDMALDAAERTGDTSMLMDTLNNEGAGAIKARLAKTLPEGAAFEGIVVTQFGDLQPVGLMPDGTRVYGEATPITKQYSQQYMAKRNAERLAMEKAQADIDAARALAEQRRGAGGGEKAPTGYRFTADGNLEAIPGGPAFQKEQNMDEKQRAKADAGIAQAERLITKVDQALEKVSGWTAGVGEALQPGLVTRMTGAADLKADLETIKANLGFAELQAMREASPTGGALGQVAVQELVALQSTVASLDQAQSPDQLRERLGEVKKHYENWRNAVMQARDGVKTNGGGSPQADAASGWPLPGAVEDGYRFKGGNPADPNSWEAI
jgi:hypothetical protein